jgi:hypothetical protein
MNGYQNPNNKVWFLTLVQLIIKTQCGMRKDSTIKVSP